MVDILLVDDDPVNQMLAEKIIRAMGIVGTIHKAGNGEEALAILHRSRAGLIKVPGFILLDIHMPVMDGFAFMEAFRNMVDIDTAAIEIVVATSSASRSDWEKMALLGIVHYITKPINPETIRRILLKLPSSN